MTLGKSGGTGGSSEFDRKAKHDKLILLLQNADTLQEAFEALRGGNIEFVIRTLSSPEASNGAELRVLEAHKEYELIGHAVGSTLLETRDVILHPYGSEIGYVLQEYR